MNKFLKMLLFRTETEETKHMAMPPIRTAGPVINSSKKYEAVMPYKDSWQARYIEAQIDELKQTKLKESQMNYLKLIPTILATIHALEDLLPDSTGAEKFKALVDIIENIVGSAVENLPALQKFVSVVVAGLKALGIFKSKAVVQA